MRFKEVDANLKGRHGEVQASAKESRDAVKIVSL